MLNNVKSISPESFVYMTSVTVLDGADTIGGNIGLLRGDIPIVTSTTSAAILKAMRDSAPAGLGSEISYYSPKTPIPQCGARNWKSSFGNTGFIGLLVLKFSLS
jgi:hypothetical protein